MKIKKIKFIYFDIGGVLVDHVSALKKIANELKISEKKVIALFAKHCDEIDRGTLPWKDFESIFYNKLNPSSKLKACFLESFVNNFEKIKETHNSIHELKDKFDIGIISNVAKDAFRLVKSKNLIPNINYKAVVKSAEIKFIKPEKEIFDYALTQINVPPNEILFIDDNEINVKAAKSFGWNSVLFNTQNPSKSIKKIKKILSN